MEFLGQIGIDPKMVLAQMVNFLILVFILRLVLYKPILKIFKEREKATETLEKNIGDIEKNKYIKKNGSNTKTSIFKCGKYVVLPISKPRLR